MGILLKGGTLIDCTGAAPLKDAAVLVEGARIADVGPQTQVTKRAGEGHEVIDLKGNTLLAGLWDAHFHLGGVVPPWGEAHAHESETVYAARGIRKLQDCLLAGITSVRTMHDKFAADQEVKKAVESGYIHGPRLFVSGEARWTRTAAGAAAFRSKVRSLLQSGVDHIKVFVTSGIPYKTGVTTVLIQPEEVRALVEEAHRWNRPVSAHAIGDDGVIMAADAGVDSVEHAFVVGEAGIEAMVRNNTIYSPQLAVTAAWTEEFMRGEGCFPEWMIVNAADAGRVHHSMFKKAVQAGLRMVTGVDNLPRMPLFHGIERFEGKPAHVAEMHFMIQGGMSNMEAIQAGTINPAILSRVDKDLGTVEKGKYADLIVVEGDPLKDIQALHNLRLVMKAGVVQRTSLNSTDPAGFLPPAEYFDAPIAMSGGETMVTGTTRRKA